MSDLTTRDRILDTAERLFAKDGFGATSLRAIIKAAGVNTAAVHYHFGSRDDLVSAVIARHAEPINRERLERLDALEADAAGKPVPAAAIVDAFIGPVIDAQHASRERGEILRRLIGRVAMDANLELQGVISRLFEEVGTRFVRALRASLPDLDDNELFWRLHFMMGAMCFSLSIPRAHKCPGNLPMPDDTPDRLRQQLVQFVSAGLAADASATRTSQK